MDFRALVRGLEHIRLDPTQGFQTGTRVISWLVGEPLEQTYKVSISPTFYEQLFCTKKCFAQILFTYNLGLYFFGERRKS